jgi:hypothetical protein
VDVVGAVITVAILRDVQLGLEAGEIGKAAQWLTRIARAFEIDEISV